MTQIEIQPQPPTPPAPTPPAPGPGRPVEARAPGANHLGAELSVAGVSVKTADDKVLLRDIDLTVRPGELVAIVGPSGSGKSTLLDVMAGNAAPSEGTVLVDGVDAHLLTGSDRRALGFVPQAEILNDDLPLGRMLDYAARLRLPRGTTRARRRLLVDLALAQVDLGDVADVVVKRLSGGQRRRASIAVELLTSPRACLLDEPTSGLDPATADTIVSELRALADAGRTVVFATHNANDLRRCDRIVAVGGAPADGGGAGIIFDGSQYDAANLVGSADVEAVHRALVTGHVGPRPAMALADSPTVRLATARRGTDPLVSTTATLSPVPVAAAGPAPVRQWAALTTRTLETVVRNKLTLAIMVGSPAMVVAMFAVLFQPGAFDPAGPSPTSTIMIAFWVAFGGFFFGLTYGLLQIVPEVAVMRREHRSGVSPGLQILAKLAALTPILLAIDVAMLAILIWLDRLPAAGIEAYLRVGITLGLDAVAALALGLLASALVRNPAQASLALPMLCFPAVLFSGAVLPVPVMAPVGRGISAAMSDRWAFELIGNDLGLRALFAADPSPLGPALLEEYGSTWTTTHLSGWTILAAFIVGLSLAAWVALRHRCLTPERATASTGS